MGEQDGGTILKLCLYNHRKIGGNETFSHVTHKLDGKVFFIEASVKQMHSGGSMWVASQENCLKENGALDHEVSHERKKMKTPYSCLDFFLSWDLGHW